MRHFIAFLLGFTLSAGFAFASAKGISFPPFTVQDEGTPLTQRYAINFAGTGVSCADDTNRTTCTISSGGASPLTTKGDLYTRSTVDTRLAVGADGLCLKANSGTATGLEWNTCAASGAYATVQDEASSLTQRSTLNFTGAGISCVDNAGASRTDCTVAGGSGSPSGTAGSIQYNDGAGAFAGSTHVSIDGGYLLLENAAEPGDAPEGIYMWSEQRAGRRMIAFKGLDFDRYAQTAIWDDRIAFTKFTGASAGKTDVGWATTAVGTAAATTFATTNLSTSITRAAYTTGTTASTPAEMRVSSAATYWRGNAAGLGGYWCSLRWTNPTHNTNSDKMLVGMTSVTTAIAGTVVPSATVNAVYCGWDAAASAIGLCGNDGTGTATCTTCSATDFPITSTTNVYECSIHARPNGTGVQLELRRLDNSAVTPCTATITAAADQPANTVFLAPRIWGSNGTTAANFAVHFISMYCTSDN